MTTERTPAERIPVVILAGGLGTRLREETERVPKPLVEIGEHPILWHVMKLYGHYGFRRFVLPLGYKSWLIKQYFLQFREQLADFTVHLGKDAEPVFHNQPGREDWEVTCVETGLLTATAGRLRRVASHLDTDTFALTYGDGIGRVALDRLLEAHYRLGRIGTVTAVHPTSRYGEMRADGDAVAEFNEKPTTPEGFVSGGFFLFQRAFLDYLDDRDDQMMEHAPLQRLARDGQLSIFPHEGFWTGMDTYREFTELNELWRAGDPPWKVWSD